MLIDLTAHYTRFNIERYPGSLVVLIPGGEVRGPLRQLLGKVTRLTPIHESPELLGFKLLPTEQPSYADEDAKGWEYNVYVEHKAPALRQHVQVILRQEGTNGRWVVRTKGQLGASVDVTLPGFEMDDPSPIALTQEGLRWRTLREMAWPVDEEP